MNQPTRDLGTLRKGEVIGGLIYLPMFLVGTQILAVLIVLLFTGKRDYAEVSVPINLVYTGLNAVSLCLIFRHYLADQLRRLLARGWALFGYLLLGYAVYYGLALLISAAMELLSELFHIEYYNANQETVEAILARAPLPSIFMICVLAPVGEELLFRGLIFCGLYRRSRPLAYALSMFAFALVHVYGSMFSQPIGVTVLVLMAYLPHSFALAWIYERSGTIFCSIFLHSVMNTLMLFLLQAMR